MRYIFLSLFFSFSLSGGENESRAKIHWWRRESIMPYPPRPLTIVGMTTYTAPAITPAPAITEEDEGEEVANVTDLDAVEIDSEIDRYLTELRNQDNEDEPGLTVRRPAPPQREASRRDVHIPVIPPPGRTFWDRVASWCSYDRRGRR